MSKSETPTVTLKIDGEEVVKQLPWKWGICHECSGDGKHSKHLGAFSGRRLEEFRADEEVWEGYIGGAYDKRCDDCGGSGKIRVVDRDAAKPDELKAYDEERQTDAEIDSIHRQEMLMEGGWREMGWFDND